MKVQGWVIIAAGVIFYVGVNTIVKAVEGILYPKQKSETKRIQEA